MNKIIKTLLLSSLIIGMATGCERGGNSKEQSRSEPNSDVSSSVFNSSSEQQSSSESSSSKESSVASSSSNSSSSVSSAASSSASSSSAQSSTSAASSSSSAASSSSSSSSSLSTPPLPQNISLGTWGVKKTYDQGEALDLTGLIVNVSYKDGSSKTVTNYTSNPADGTILNELGEQPVTISYLTLSASFTITVEVPVKRNWTEAEAKIMSDHLNGVVLPYTGMEESVVSYDAKYETVYIIGGKITSQQMSAFTEAMNGLAFNLTYNVNTGAYSFNKQVTYQNETRTVKGIYYKDENGDFYLEAYDPYYYNFPSAIIQELIKKSLYSEEILPAYTADRYQMDTDNGAVYCYTNSTTAEADYTAILVAAGWNASGTMDSTTGFYSAVSPNEDYMIYYHYEGDPYYSLDIYVTPINYWNDKPINNFYQKYTNYSVEIPHLDVNNAGYLFRNSEINDPAYEQGSIELIHSFLYIYNATKSDLERYVGILKTASWQISGGDTLYKALLEYKDEGLIRIEAEYSSVYSAVIITFYAMLEPYPIEGWPYDEIAEILSSDVTDVLPAFEGENKGFTIMNDMWGTSVSIAVEDGTEANAIKSYQRTLEKNGYVVNGAIGSDPIYISKNNQIWVNPYRGGTGLVTVDFKMMPNIWPKANIAKELNKLFGRITEAVPAYPGAEKYQLDPDDKALYILITLPSGVSAQTALKEYLAILQANSYTEVGLDDDDDMHYLSPLGQLDICPYIDSRGRFVLYVTSLNVTEVWPNTAINAWLSAKSFTDTLPEYTGEYLSAVADEEDGFSVVITLDNPTTDDIEDAMDFYCYTLFQSSFEHTDTLPFGLGEEYTSPNKQFTVVVSPNDDGFELILDEAEKDSLIGGDFPSDSILSVFPQAQGILPVIADENAEYETDVYSDYVGLLVSFANRTDAENAYDQYIEDLVGYSYEPQEIWGGYAIAYYSPDGSFCVVLTDYFQENTIYIDFYASDSDYLE